MGWNCGRDVKAGVAWERVKDSIPISGLENGWG